MPLMLALGAMPLTPRLTGNLLENTKSTLVDVMAALDELAHATHSNDHKRYMRALTEANRCGLSDEQIRDSYQWGRLRLGEARFNKPTSFNWRGEQRTT